MPYNGLSYLFSNMSYELNGHVIDRVSNCGTTTTMKSYLSKCNGNAKYLESCGFNHNRDPYSSSYTATSSGHIEVHIPCFSLMGYFEDYRKPIINAIQELILIRSRDDSNIFIHPAPAADVAATAITAVNPTITLTEVSWKMPVLKFSDYARVQLLNIIKDNRKIDIPFRTWDLYEYPTLPTSVSISWTIKTTHSLLKPRYVIVAFQTNKRNRYDQNVSLFDSVNLQAIRLSLNEDQYPHEAPYFNFANGKHDILYHMFSQFQMSYYGKPCPETTIGSSDFFKGSHPTPMVVFDCSKQKESMEPSGVAPMNVRLDFTCAENIPANTTAYCLIIYDRLFSYYPLHGTVKQIL